jgi:CheY-like chemotaxis protein
MTKYCVLVVDDQRDIRRVLRAGLETLGLDLQVIDVPSGEEALLVLSNHPVDVLVTDVRLPGISGLELKERARVRNPAVDLILITGLSDPGIRQSIEAAGAAAFFYKPVEMIEFLDAVKRCLERPRPEHRQMGAADQGAQGYQDQKESRTLAEELADLRQDINANAVLLLDESGRSVAQAGEIPDIMNGGAFASALLAAVHAGTELSSHLGMLVPESISIFRGLQTDFLLAPVGPTATLLISVPAGFSPRTLGERFVVMSKSVQNLLEIIQSDVEAPNPTQMPQPISDAEEATLVEVEEEPLLDEIFSQASRENYKPEEVDAYWDSLVEDDRAEGVINANAISYDQARKLGLTPDRDSE